MTLQQLRYLCEIAARDWNISKAARALHTSQPGISRQMQSLEQELGIAIFTRHNNRIAGVTEMGRLALTMAQRIVSESDELRSIRNHFDTGASRSIKIAATHTQARYALPSVVKQFTARHPGVEVSLLQGVPLALAKFVSSQEADISVSTEPADVPEDVVMIPLLVVKRLAIMPRTHPLAKHEKLTLKELSQYPIITYANAFVGRSMVLSAFEKEGLVPNVVISAVDTDIMKAYAAQGMGIAIMSEVAYNEVADRGLRAICVSEVLGEDTVCLGLRRFALIRPLVAEFIAMLAPGLDEATLARAVYGRQIRAPSRRETGFHSPGSS